MEVIDNTIGSRERRRCLGLLTLRLAGPALALPFLVGGVVLAWELNRLPSSAGQLATSQLLSAMLFAFGFFMGLLGAASSVTARTPGGRVLDTAMTLFGCSHIILSFAIRRSAEASVFGNTTPIAPFVLPIALWAYSVWLAVRAHGLDSQADDSATSAEQQQPLSQS